VGWRRILILPLILAVPACALDDASTREAPDPGAPISDDPWGGAGAGGAAGAAGARSDLGGAAGESATGGASATGGEGGGASCPRVVVKVAAGDTLNVRPTPATDQAPVGKLANGAIVDVLAQVKGEAIDGNDLWFQIAAPSLTGYIFSAFAACTLEEAPVAPDGYYVPLECGKSAKISQGNFGSFSHQGKAKYAFDFSIPVGTPMTAMADGTVIHLYDQTGPGDPCYDGGGSECFPYANLVVLLHGDGTATLYKHLSKVKVSMGQVVTRGTVVGLSGSTGYSTGPHAHVMRMEDCGTYNCQSVPLSFADVPGGVPATGDSVTSGNCP